MLTISQTWLLTGQGEMISRAAGDTSSSGGRVNPSPPFPTSDLVPIFDHASVEAAASANGADFGEDESITGLTWWPRALLRDTFGVDDPTRVRRITVTGDSNWPTLQSGQKVFVVLLDVDDAPVSGALYLIAGPYGLLIKRVVMGSVREEDGFRYQVTLRSDNEDKRAYPDEVFPLEVFRQDFRLLGHVPRAEVAL